MRLRRDAIPGTRPLLLAALLAAGAPGLSACANTRLVSSWREPTASQIVFRKILAVAMVRTEARRHAVEDRMVLDIQRGGAEAVPSYRVIAAADTRSLDAVKAAVASGGFDGAVTWRTVSARDETTWVEGPHMGFWGYYDAGWAGAYDTEYLRTDRIIRVETMVYQVAGGAGSDRLIWRGESRTVDPESLDALVDGVADATIDAMRGNGLLATRR